MNPKMVECVPNISEGRNNNIVQQCIQAIESVQGVKMVDFSSDPDHNRSVLTFIGPVEDVIEAAVRLTTKAIELINLRHILALIRGWERSMSFRLFRWSILRWKNVFRRVNG